MSEQQWMWQPIEDGFEIDCEENDGWKLYQSEGDIGVVDATDREKEHYVYAEPHIERNICVVG